MMAAEGIGALVVGLNMPIFDWLSPSVNWVVDFSDFVFFKLLLARLEHDIGVLQESMLGGIGRYVAAIAYVLTFLWVLIQGYRVLTGQLREAPMALVANTAKVVFIVSVAISFGAGSGSVHKLLANDMRSGIHELITGSNKDPNEQIDANLSWMQVAMSSLDILDSGGDLDTSAEKDRAALLIGVGTGGPALVSGAMMLMYEVALAMFIGFGPLFILCLLFESTKSLFHRWLLYGVGTMFSLAILSAMSSIALGMVADVALGMWGADALTTLVPGFGGGAVISFNSRAIQSGGMGIILTMLLVSVPPMAAMFFGGTLGSFMHYSVFGGGATPAPSAGGPAGAPAYPMPSRPDAVSRDTPTHAVGPSPVSSSEGDGIKQGSSLRGT